MDNKNYQQNQTDNELGKVFREYMGYAKAALLSSDIPEFKRIMNVCYELLFTQYEYVTGVRKIISEKMRVENNNKAKEIMQNFLLKQKSSIDKIVEGLDGWDGLVESLLNIKLNTQEEN